MANKEEIIKKAIKEVLGDSEQWNFDTQISSYVDCGVVYILFGPDDNPDNQKLVATVALVDNDQEPMGIEIRMKDWRTKNE